MKYIHLTTKLLFFFSLLLASQINAQVKNILWLGNSFTGGTELNKYVKGMINAGSTGITVNLSDTHILWGYNLDEHWRSVKSLDMIRSKKYDYVVLQGYINMGDLGYATQRVNAIKYGILLADEIRANNGQPIIFCAHANENSSASQWDYVINSYKKVADTSNSIFAPASVAWVEAKAQDPSLKLFTADGHHQNEFSNYLNMCVFYYTITGKSPVGNPYRLSNRDRVEITLSDAMALKLQQYAATVVERIKGTEIKVTGLTLKPASGNIMVDETIDMEINYLPSNASNRRVVWTSSNPSVATVNNLGAVTGVSLGNVTITAKSADGDVSATASFSVVPNTAIRVTGITLDKTEVSLNIGESTNLLASILPVDATNKKITWLSSNYVAVSVDPTGVVKGLMGGFSKITATTLDGSFVAVCNVIVNAPIVARGDNMPSEGIDRLTNGNLNDKWLDFSPTSFVLFSYDNGRAWNSYEITSGNDTPERDPKNWTIQGSNNQSDWVTLDTKVNESWTARNQTKKYSFSNTQFYTYYKWDITANGGAPIIQASEFKFSGLVLSVASNEPGADNFALYPNPASNEIFVKIGDGAANAEVTVTDIQGRTMINSSLSSTENLVNISQLDKGVYFVNVKADNKYENFKFIKK